METDDVTLDRNADQIVKEIGIPPCPEILTKLLREIREDEPDSRRVSQLICADVALASAVLKIANSPLYGLHNKASSVQQALTMLGLITVTQLVTGLLLRQSFAGATGPSMERYWKASMASSLISPLLARETGCVDTGLACTYGLFRDCGTPVMLQKFPKSTDVFDGSALTPGEYALDIENERYATNHAVIGARLARSWHLPESLCTAIEKHHDVMYDDDMRLFGDPSVLSLIAIGLVAEKLYCNANGRLSNEWAVAGEWALSELDLSRDKYEDIAIRVLASVKQF